MLCKIMWQNNESLFGLNALAVAALSFARNIILSVSFAYYSMPCNNTVKGAPYAVCTRMHAYMQSYPYVHSITRILDLQDIGK